MLGYSSRSVLSSARNSYPTPTPSCAAIKEPQGLLPLDTIVEFQPGHLPPQLDRAVPSYDPDGK